MLNDYWHSVFARAFWDSLRSFDTSPRLLLLGVAGAIVTAVLVLLIRGRKAFKEHLVTNIAIAFGGAILTWFCVFAYQFVRAPYLIQADAKQDAKRAQKAEDEAELQRQLSAKDSVIKAQEGEIQRLRNRPTPPKVVYRDRPSSAEAESGTKTEIAAGLQKIYDDGQKLASEFFNSDDGLAVNVCNNKYAAWRGELRRYITQRISVGKAQYVDGIASVVAMAYSGMKSINTRLEKENLITHINARLQRLSEIMKDY